MSLLAPAPRLHVALWWPVRPGAVQKVQMVYKHGIFVPDPHYTAWVQKVEVVQQAHFADKLGVPSQRHARKGGRGMLHSFHWDDSLGSAHPCQRTLQCGGLNKCKLPASLTHLTPRQGTRRSGRSGEAYVIGLAAPLHGELQNILSLTQDLDKPLW